MLLFRLNTMVRIYDAAQFKTFLMQKYKIHSVSKFSLLISHPHTHTHTTKSILTALQNMDNNQPPAILHHRSRLKTLLKQNYPQASGFLKFDLNLPDNSADFFSCPKYASRNKQTASASGTIVDWHFSTCTCSYLKYYLQAHCCSSSCPVAVCLHCELKKG